jgi:hypothetical protein
MIRLKESLQRRIIMSKHQHNGTPCWDWIGHRTKSGYGHLKITDAAGQRHSKSAHTAVYVALYGEIQDGLELDHLCKRRCCVNPEHMEPVTHRENIVRSYAGKCRKGHLMDGQAYVDPRGKRQCRICRNLRIEYYKKKPLSDVIINELL